MPVELLNSPNVDINFGFKDQVDPNISRLTQEVGFDELYAPAGRGGAYISKYPTYMPDRDNEDYFAQQQGMFNKLRNSMGQFGIMAGTFGAYFSQYGRDLDAIFSGNMSALWDSEGTDRLARNIESANIRFPIYDSKRARERREKEKGLLGALAQYIPGTAGAGSAWARLGGQLGFTAGTIGAVVAENVALAITTGGYGNVAKAPVTASRAVKSFWQLARAGETFKTTADMSRLTRLAKNAGVSYRLAHASAGEATIEASLAEREYIREQIEAFEETYGRRPTSGERMAIEREAIKVGNTTFGWNMPVLMASNVVTIGNLFVPKGFMGRSLVPGIDKIVARNGTFKTTKELVKESNSKLTKGVFFAKNALKKSQEVLGEGFEELAQGIGSSSARSFYDLYASPYADDTLGFMAVLGKETSHSLNSREGWDEFVAGALTGVGIKGFNTLISRGKGDGRTERTEQAKKELQQAYNILTDPAKPENENLIVQMASAYGMQDAVNEDNEYRARNLKAVAKRHFLSTMRKYNKTDEVLDMYGDALKEMREKDESAYKALVGEGSVEQTIADLKAEAEEFNTLRNKADKKFKNKYNANSQYNQHVAFEKAKDALVGFYMDHKDSFQRAQDLDAYLKTRPEIASVVEAITNPENLQQSIANAESFIKIAKENLKTAETQGEKDALREEIKQQATLLKVLKDIDKTSEGNPNDIASRIVNEIYKKQGKSIPEGVQQDIADLIRLEDDSAIFLATYNALSDPKTFSKYWRGFSSVAMENTRVPEGDQTQLEGQEDVTPVEDQPGLTEEEFDDEVGEITFDDGVGIKTVTSDALSLLAQEDPKIRETEAGYEYNGQTYETREQAHDAILNASPDANKMSTPTSSGQTLRSAIKRRFTTGVTRPTEQVQQDPNEELRQPVAQTTQSLRPPKTKDHIERQNNSGWLKSDAKYTILHFFDKVISKIWPFSQMSFILDRLASSADPIHFKVVGQINDAWREFGGEAQLTMISLYGEQNIEKKDNDQIKVFSDGVRFFIVTRGKANASQIIREQLGLDVQQGKGWSIVRMENGTEITSDYELSSTKEESAEAISKLKRGDILNVKVVDNDFNRKLKKEKPEGWEDHLIVEVYRVNEDGTETAVGMLRATDFLFQDSDKKAEIDALRDRVKNSKLGTLAGTVPLVEFTSARNVGYEGGQIKYTPLETYEKGMDEIGWDVDYFFATDADVLIDQKGNRVDVTTFDRPSFRKGAIYMRVKKRGSSQEHTIQVVNNRDSRYSAQQFTSGSFKETAQTYLRERSQPLISKRIVTDTTKFTLPGETAPVELGVRSSAQTTTTAPVQEDTFANATNKRVWIVQNGQRGDVYTLPDGTEVTVLDTAENEATVKKQKGNFHTIEKYTLEDGKVKAKNQIKGNVTSRQVKNPTRTILFDIHQKIENEEPLSTWEYNIAVRHPDRLAKIRQKVAGFYENVSADPIKNLKKALVRLGQDAETIFNGLLRAYVQSVLNRQPINDWETLVESAGLTETQKEALELVVNPVTTPLVWAFVTQADAIWGFRRNKGFEKLLEGMQEELRDLNNKTQALNERKSPYRRAQEVRDNIVEKLRDKMNEVGIDFTHEKLLNLLPEIDFKAVVREVVATLTPTRFIEGIKSLQERLAQYEIGITLGGILQIKSLDLNSRGRNPQYFADYDSIYTDVAMMPESELVGTTVVRNEKDGLFVEVHNVNRRVTPEISAMQKRLLDLLGVEVSPEYLQAYKKVNGSFEGLKRRILAEEIRSGQEVPNSFGIVEVENLEDVKERALDRTGKLLSVHGSIRLVNSTDYYIKIDGKVYRNVMNLTDRKGAYVLDSRPLSQEQVRDSLLKANIRPEKPKNFNSQVKESLGDKTKLEKLKDDLSCGL